MITVARLFNERDFLAAVGAGAQVAIYPPKRPLYHQGDPADCLYFLEKGQVKLTAVSKRGREAVVAVLGPGDFVGEACLAGKNLRSTSATPLSECRAVRIEKAAATKMVRSDPVFAERFLAYVLIRNLRIQEDLMDHLLNSSEKRLARALLLLASGGEPKRGGIAIPRVSQEVLADMIGTTRSRVSYFMNKFRKLGHVAYDGRIVVYSTLHEIVPDA